MIKVNRNDFSYIRDRMNEEKYNATDLAKLIGVETSTITRILRGEIKYPRFCMMVDIHKALNMPLYANKNGETIKFK